MSARACWIPVLCCLYTLSGAGCQGAPRPSSEDCPGCDVLADAGPGDPQPGEPDAAPAAFCSRLGSFPAAWISGGAACGSEAQIQVHQLNADTFILRQSLCTSGEAPFFYLLFGDDKALLEDTGDGGIDLVGTVDTLVAEREAAIGHSLELVVVNSHAHGDHVQANTAFAASGATVVGFNKAQMMDFFGMGWPRSPASYDLGGRSVEIMGIPGHQRDHIAIYDTAYGLLLTGDTLYPGRLYINDFPEYKASVSFLVDYSSGKDVCAVLGTHIEMSTTPGQDYSLGVQSHPSEHELALSRETLVELNSAVQAMGANASRQTHDDFIIFPL